ncbi:hypothetical protein [Oceanobacillus kapialis]|uniref:DUF4321 domain-containing protein n=1 Tax=Oceanobacillus kapialis TaxID=481353 RepID=A0ABW5PZ26_9BACI
MDRMKIVVLSFIIGVVGLFIIFFSVHLGTSVADTWLAELGSVSTEVYLARMNGYIVNFQLIGGILFGIGLFGALLFYYKMSISN